jgi:phosphoribosylformimino-5-aminoimidazole carboxamide ribotide isomerase
MKFRPCIDLMDGRVVQIVGGSLTDDNSASPQINFQAEKPPGFYAGLYQKDGLTGGHVIALGPGNREAALSALHSFPGGLQMGGGVTPTNALDYLDAGASHVIVTSYVFRDGQVCMDRLKAIAGLVGKHRLVLDLSCRKRDSEFWVVTNRWQQFTNVKISPETLCKLSTFCDEFLVHAVDVEGRMAGIQAELVEILGKSSPISVTYAGGVQHLKDLEVVNQLGQGRVDLTIGSALDIFGGQIPYTDVLQWSRTNNARSTTTTT